MTPPLPAVVLLRSDSPEVAAARGELAPLHCAGAGGHCAAVAWLLAHDADARAVPLPLFPQLFGEQHCIYPSCLKRKETEVRHSP